MVGQSFEQLTPGSHVTPPGILQEEIPRSQDKDEVKGVRIQEFKRPEPIKDSPERMTKEEGLQMFREIRHSGLEVQQQIAERLGIGSLEELRGSDISRDQIIDAYHEAKNEKVEQTEEQIDDTEHYEGKAQAEAEDSLVDRWMPNLARGLDTKENRGKIHEQLERVYENLKPEMEDKRSKAIARRSRWGDHPASTSMDKAEIDRKLDQEMDEAMRRGAALAVQSILRGREVKNLAEVKQGQVVYEEGVKRGETTGRRKQALENMKSDEEKARVAALNEETAEETEARREREEQRRQESLQRIKIEHANPRQPGDSFSTYNIRISDLVKKERERLANIQNSSVTSPTERRREPVRKVGQSAHRSGIAPVRGYSVSNMMKELEKKKLGGALEPEEIEDALEGSVRVGFFTKVFNRKKIKALKEIRRLKARTARRRRR